MVSKGFFPGYIDANDAWPGGCQSCAVTTQGNCAAMRFTSGTISSPFGTASAPSGMKSFWMSTRIRQASLIGRFTAL